MRFSHLFICSALATACAAAPQAEDARPDASDRADTRAHSSGDDHRSSAVNRALARVRQATRAYHDPAEAEADGYHFEPHCISGAEVGAPPEAGDMGFHYVNPALIDDIFDPLEPEVLVYEERGNGSLHLTAVEYLYVGSDAPMFAGEVAFHHFPPPFADYALHAWIWKGNPAGTFADLNPTVSCPDDG